MSVSVDRPNPENTLAFLFPGQGGQAQKLGLSLAERSKKAADIKQMAADIFGGEFVDIWTNGPIEKINRTRWTQYIVATDMAMRMAALHEEKPGGTEGWFGENGVTKEKWRDGQSFGIALAGAGIWYSTEEALKFINVRGRVMGEFFAGLDAKMFALVDVTEDRRAEMSRKADVRLCLDNTDTQQVFGGDTKNADEAMRWLTEKIKEEDPDADPSEYVIPLTIEGVFHHPILLPVVQALTPAVEGMKFYSEAQDGKILMSNITGLSLETEAQARAELLGHNLVPVQHRLSMKYLVGQGVTCMAGVTNSRRLAIMNQDMFEGDARVQITMKKKSDDDKPPVLLQGWKAD